MRFLCCFGREEGAGGGKSSGRKINFDLLAKDFPELVFLSRARDKSIYECLAADAVYDGGKQNFPILITFHFAPKRFLF